MVGEKNQSVKDSHNVSNPEQFSSTLIIVKTKQIRALLSYTGANPGYFPKEIHTYTCPLFCRQFIFLFGNKSLCSFPESYKPILVGGGGGGGLV